MNNSSAVTSDTAPDIEPAYASQLDATLAAVERLALSLQMVIEYEGFSYQSECPATEYTSGRRGSHRCDYSITLRDGMALGTLEVSRSWPFRESELRLLECCVADFILRLDQSIAASQLS